MCNWNSVVRISQYVIVVGLKCFTQLGTKRNDKELNSSLPWLTMFALYGTSWALYSCGLYFDVHIQIYVKSTREEVCRLVCAVCRFSFNFMRRSRAFIPWMSLLNQLIYRNFFTNLLTSLLNCYNVPIFGMHNGNPPYCPRYRQAERHHYDYLFFSAFSNKSFFVVRA